MVSQRKKYSVHSVEKAFSVLETFKEEREQRTIDISRKLGLSKSMVFKILATLNMLGYVSKNPETGRYRLGIRLFELGCNALNHIRDWEGLHAILQQLVDFSNETAHFAILQDGEVLYLDKVESRASLRMVSKIGFRRPAYCTGTGKALLAWQPEEVVRRIMSGNVIRFTEKTITDIDALLSDLNMVRQRGYAVDNEENEVGIISIGAPVRNHLGEVVAAVSLSGPTVRITAGVIPVLAQKVMEAAQIMRDKVGYLL